MFTAVAKQANKMCFPPQSSPKAFVASYRNLFLRFFFWKKTFPCFMFAFKVFVFFYELNSFVMVEKDLVKAFLKFLFLICWNNKVKKFIFVHLTFV